MSSGDASRALSAAGERRAGEVSCTIEEVEPILFPLDAQLRFDATLAASATGLDALQIAALPEKVESVFFSLDPEPCFLATCHFDFSVRVAVLSNGTSRWRSKSSDRFGDRVVLNTVTIATDS